MLDFALKVSAVLFAIAILLNLYRVAIGPSLPDRILALDTMYVNSIA